MLVNVMAPNLWHPSGHKSLNAVLHAKADVHPEPPRADQSDMLRCGISPDSWSLWREQVCPSSWFHSLLGHSLSEKESSTPNIASPRLASEKASIWLVARGSELSPETCRHLMLVPSCLKAHSSRVVWPQSNCLEFKETKPPISPCWTLYWVFKDFSAWRKQYEKQQDSSEQSFTWEREEEDSWHEQPPLGSSTNHAKWKQLTPSFPVS